jgi:septin family protein
MEDNAKDDYCRILVAGGTGSGKSTFINRLLCRKILPSEGGSLTSTFVKIFDTRDTHGKKEVHLHKKEGAMITKVLFQQLNEKATLIHANVRSLQL